MSKHGKLNRRGFLTGLGGIALSLPFLERFAREAVAAPTATGPKRIIVVSYMMGVPGPHWRPSTVGTGFTLPFITAPLEPFRDRCLFVSDIDNTMLSQGGQSFVYGHPGKTEAALSGTLTSGAFPATNTNHISQIIPNTGAVGGANAPTVEHFIGQGLYAGQPFQSVDLGVDANIYWGGAPGIARSRFHFEGRDTAVSMQCDPVAAFNRYFAQVPQQGDTGAQAALLELRTRNKSVLDAVRDSYADVARDLGTDDRRRLEEHAARIRQIELDSGPIALCAPPTGIGPGNGQRMNTLAATQIRLLAQAMACDLAPVARLEFVNQQNPRFGIPTLDSTLDNAPNYDWHGMVHGNPLPGTPADAYLRPGRSPNVTTYDSRLLESYRFFVQQFADLLAALDGFAEGNGRTVLDNSLVVLASDLGEGSGHYHGKMGYIFAGNLGGARTNYHYRCSPNSDLYTTSTYEVIQLLNSVVDMAGGTAIGAPSEIGLQGYLAQAGKPRRIDGLFA